MATLFNNDTIGNTIPEGMETIYANGHKHKLHWLGKGKAWYYVPEWELTIGVAPKCGTRTIYKLLENVNFYSAPNPDIRPVFIVRHPVERFSSLWKQKCRDGRRISTIDNPSNYAKDWSIDELLDHIERGLWNHHWAPQSVFEMGAAEELVPLEKLNQWLHDEGLGPPTHLNQTVGEVQLTDDQYRRVVEYYIDDVRL